MLRDKKERKRKKQNVRKDYPSLVKPEIALGFREKRELGVPEAG